LGNRLGATLLEAVAVIGGLWMLVGMYLAREQGKLLQEEEGRSVKANNEEDYGTF
jgi:hypothetical protein